METVVNLNSNGKDVNNWHVKNMWKLDYRTTVLISGRKRKVEFECGKGSKKGGTD